MRLRHPLWVIAVCTAALSGTSCADFGSQQSNSYWPFADKKDTVPGVQTARERIDAIKLLAKEAPSKSPAEQTRVSADLAAQLQREQDPLLRIELLTALAAFNTPAATAMLDAGLADNDVQVREACCAAWAKRGGDEAVDALTRALASDTNLDVRLAAARALGETRSPRAVAPLGEALSDADPALQFRAVESLRAVSGRDFGDDLGAWQQFAKGGPVDTKTPSLAERLRNLF